MKVSQFMAKQYANPSGLFGRVVISRFLNRANKLSNRAVYEALEIEPGSRLLEIGFGGGELLLHIARNAGCSEVCGVERSEEMVQRLNRTILSDPALQTINPTLGDITALPVAENYFDRVCSVNTIYFWPDLDAGCLELARVTANNGRIVLGYAFGEKLSRSGYAENGFRFYTPDEIHSAMDKAGFALQTSNQLDRKNKDPFYVSGYRKREQ